MYIEKFFVYTQKKITTLRPMIGPLIRSSYSPEIAKCMTPPGAIAGETEED